MESVDYHQAVELLRWQIELGATEAISDLPVNRYEVPASVEKPKLTAPQGKQRGPVAGGVDPVAEASRQVHRLWTRCKQQSQPLIIAS